jgi:hypothetical protein
MLSNHVLNNLRIIAINNAMSDTVDWFIEKSYRHYSRTYHTPLHIAKETLSQEEAVLIFMEDECSEMSPEDIVMLKEKLSTKIKPVLDFEGESDEDVEMDDDAWVAQQMAELEAKERKPVVTQESMDEAKKKAISGCQH